MVTEVILLEITRRVVHCAFDEVEYADKEEEDNADDTPRTLYLCKTNMMMKKLTCH